MRREEVVGRQKEKAQKKAGRKYTRGGGKERMKMKRGLMRPSRTTRGSSSCVKPGCDRVTGTESPRHRSLHAYLSHSASRLLKVATFKQP